MLSLLACVLLVVVLGLAVLASMVVENWGRWTVSVPTGVLATETLLPASADGDVDLVIDGRAAADRAVAVLLGAYAADRYPEANRAAAWVTAADGPPGRLGESYPAGVDLRARPVAVGRLLDCADQGRCWLRSRRAPTSAGDCAPAHPPAPCCVAVR